MSEDQTQTTPAPAAEPAGEQATPASDPSGILDAQAKAGPQPEPKAEPAGEQPKAEPAKEPAKDEPKPEDAKEEPKEDDRPIEDWSKVKLDIPEGAPVDQPTLDAFGKAAVEMGLTRNQANRLVNFQLDMFARAREQAYDAGVKELGKEWGAKFAENSQAVLTLVSSIDRELGGSGTEFSKALEACGATLFPAVCKGLLHLARATSEDSFGRGGAAAQAEHEETALEGLKAAFEEAKRR